ncbi:MAG: hypothetical protein ACYC26_04225 [Phycisphaerales bacterium]
MWQTRFTGWTCLLALLAWLAGCNQFKDHYTGRRFDPVPDAAVYPQPPKEGQAVQIGSANFITSWKPGDAQAIEAAKSVGADIVWYRRIYRGTTTEVSATPHTTETTQHTTGTVTRDDGSTREVDCTTTTISTQYVPTSNTQHWFEYDAKFYRSPSAGNRVWEDAAEMGKTP